MNTPHFRACSLVLLAVALMATAVQAQIPRDLSVQLYLTDPSTGNAYPNGTYTITFALYADASTGQAIYTETVSMTVTGGIVNVVMGPIPANVTFDQQYWLGIAVGSGSEMTPRTPLTSVPYALNIDKSAAVTSLREGPTGSRLTGDVSLAGTNGIDITTDPVNNEITISGPGNGELSWELDGNAGTDPATDFVGTRDAKALHLKVNSTDRLIFNTNGSIQRDVVGSLFPANARGTNAIDLQTDRIGIAQVASGNQAVIGGGMNNTASGSQAVVGGGINNTVSGNQSVIGGGINNTVRGNRATIGGGEGNYAWEGTIGGGNNNTAIGPSATVGGGVSNEASGPWTTVGGGEDNTASVSFAVIGGGQDNIASEGYATIAGGYANNAAGVFATVGGGAVNNSSFYYTTVGGGDGNTASGYWATAGGGYRNVVAGENSVIPGGGFLTLDMNAYGSFGFLAGTGDFLLNHPMTISTPEVAVFGNADLWLVNNNDEASALRFYEANPTPGLFPGATNFTSFQAGQQSGDITYVLPLSTASSATVEEGILQLDASLGQLSWVDPALFLNPILTPNSVVVTDASGNLTTDNPPFAYDSESNSVTTENLVGTSTSNLQGPVFNSIGNLHLSDNVDVTGDVVPTADNEYDLGAPGLCWANAYIRSLTFCPDITMSADGNDLTVDGNFKVTGDATVDGRLSLPSLTPNSVVYTNASGNLATDNPPFAYDDASNTVTTENLVVTGTSDLRGAIFSMNGGLHLNDPVAVTGNVVPTSTNVYDIGSFFKCWRTGYFESIRLCAGITITGDGHGGTVLLDSAIAFEILDVGIKIHTGLEVLGNGQINGNLGVVGAAVFDDNVSVDDETTLNGDVALGDAAADAITLNGTLTGSGPGHALGTGGTDATVLTIDGMNGGVTELVVNGDANIGGTLTVGTLALNGDLDMNQFDILDLGDLQFSTAASTITNIAGDVVVNDNLNVMGSADIDADLSVDGASTLTGALDVQSAGNFVGDGTDTEQLEVQGVDGGTVEVDVNGDMDVSGTLTAGALAMNGDLFMNGNDIFDVDDLQFSRTTSEISNTSGDVVVNDNLVVAGIMDLSEDLSVGGRTTLSYGTNGAGSTIPNDVTVFEATGSPISLPGSAIDGQILYVVNSTGGGITVNGVVGGSSGSVALPSATMWAFVYANGWYEQQ